MPNHLTLPLESETLKTIAHQWGTPVYVYDEYTIRQRCRTLQGLFPDLPVRWLYAIKANDNPHIIKRIASEHMGFDTVSYEEVLLCRRLGVAPQHIFYTENNMTDDEMHRAVAEGVVLNIGSPGRLEEYCKAYPGSECCIRLKPDIGDGHHVKVDTGNRDSKFGIRMDLAAEMTALAGRSDVRIRGIHAHIGSGIQQPENLLHEINLLLQAARGFPDLEYINFGGGLPVPYKPNQEPFDLNAFARLASHRFSSFLQKHKHRLTFYFEPGRWIVAESGVLLTQVNTVKNQGKKTFLGTDTGFHHLLRPAFYDAYHEIRNITATDQKANETYDIAGNICESGDILGKNRLLPKTSSGDYLAILTSGAYGMTMASHYNRRSLPAEVLVCEDGTVKEIRPRKTPGQTVDEFLVETGFS